MLVKTFSFNRIQKTISAIEDQINEFLVENTLKFATQNESAVKGKFVVSLFHEQKKGNIRAKVFKSQSATHIDEMVNEFLNEHDMKLVTQTFVGSNIYTIIFYVEKKSTQAPISEDNI